MGANVFVKFCKIGALSATGTRPFDAGADGFVMGEGAALFVLKRLADAERDGDRIYAVLLGVGGLERRQGQGDHRPEPGRAAAGDRPGLAATPASTRSPRPASRPTARRPGSATPPSWKASPPCFGPGDRRAWLHRARLGEVEHRPPEGRRGRRWPVQAGHGRCTRRCSRRA